MAIVGILVTAMLILGIGIWSVIVNGPPSGRPIQQGHYVSKRGLQLTYRALHAYVYARWTELYVRLGKWLLPYLMPRTKRWVANRYHAKVLTHDLARAIITIEQDIPLRDLEQIIPYDRARDLILNGPPEIAVQECSCRQNAPQPCQPTQVCMIIGQPFVDFALTHRPESTRRLTRVEALALLEAEHQRGHVHSAWFKDASMGRFYAICNCCKCCCGGIEAMLKYGVPMVASSGYIASVDAALCRSCGTCVEACPFGAMTLNGRGAEIIWDHCMGCGICEGRCPYGAIALRRDERKGIPLDVRLLVHGDGGAQELPQSSMVRD